jgi:HAE1 family hydrophobic/amphiphilic exporter-1
MVATVPGLPRRRRPIGLDRYAQERQVTVVANLYETPLGEAMQQALAIVRELDLPPGHQVVQLGQAKVMAQAFATFLVAFGLTLAFIYMGLAAQFESVVHPLTIIVSIFPAMPFGFLALVLTGMTLNIYAIADLFLLIGGVQPGWRPRVPPGARLGTLLSGRRPA